jgi:hypothetical protein
VKCLAVQGDRLGHRLVRGQRILHGLGGLGLGWLGFGGFRFGGFFCRGCYAGIGRRLGRFAMLGECRKNE